MGGITTHGDANFFGSLPGLRSDDPNIGPAQAVNLSTTAIGAGYWILDDFGGIHAFGIAEFFGASTGIAGTPVGSAASPHDSGYWTAFNTDQIVAFPGGETESLTCRTFTGAGGTTVEPFELQGGVVINTYSHDGESNFIVELLDDNGDTEDLVVNETGETKGSVFGAFDGLRYLEITADGNRDISAG